MLLRWRAGYGRGSQRSPPGVGAGSGPWPLPSAIALASAAAWRTRAAGRSVQKRALCSRWPSGPRHRRPRGGAKGRSQLGGRCCRLQTLLLERDLLFFSSTHKWRLKPRAPGPAVPGRPVTRVTCQGNQDLLRLVPARAFACRA